MAKRQKSICRMTRELSGVIWIMHNLVNIYGNDWHINSIVTAPQSPMELYQFSKIEAMRRHLFTKGFDGTFGSICTTWQLAFSFIFFFLLYTLQTHSPGQHTSFYTDPFEKSGYTLLASYPRVWWAFLLSSAFT